MSQEQNNPQQGNFENYNQFTQSNMGGGQPVPNSVAVLILGILSIVFCWCYGLLSAVMGIVALVLANTGEKEYKLNPHLYSLSSYKNLKAGRICAIIGLSLSALYILLIIIYLIIFGTLAFGSLGAILENYK